MFKRLVSILELRALLMLLAACLLFGGAPVFAQDTTAPPQNTIEFSDDTLAAMFISVLGIFSALTAYFLKERGADRQQLSESVPLPLAQLWFSTSMSGARRTASLDDDNALIAEARRFGWEVVQVGSNYVLQKAVSAASPPSERNPSF